jgi:hypothetical protein
MPDRPAMMRVDRVGELDRDLDQREADKQAEYRKQEFEFAHRAKPPASRWQGGHEIPNEKGGGSRRPGTKSLWLLPSGPDQVGDSAVRRLPRRHMVERPFSCKFATRTVLH